MGRGIDHRISAADRLENGDAEAVLGAGGAQQLGGPAPAVAKGAVPADDDMAGADRSDDDFGDEILGPLGGEAEIEMLDEQQLDSEPRQFMLFGAERGQSERLGGRKEHTARMRLERQHGRGYAMSPGEVAHMADQHRMPAMQTIEIAHRKHRATRVVRSGARMSDDAGHVYRAFHRQPSGAKIARAAARG